MLEQRLQKKLHFLLIILVVGLLQIRVCKLLLLILLIRLILFKHCFPTKGVLSYRVLQALGLAQVVREGGKLGRIRLGHGFGPSNVTKKNKLSCITFFTYDLCLGFDLL